MSWFRNAFGLDPEKPREFTAEELAVLDKVAKKVHDYRMAVPAVLFLESVKPLNFVGSQVMIFFKPFVSAFFTTREYEMLASMLEERHTIEVLLTRIEQSDKGPAVPAGEERVRDGS